MTAWQIFTWTNDWVIIIEKKREEREKEKKEREKKEKIRG